MEKSLSNIINDKTSGSLEIVLKLNKYIRQICSEPEKIEETIKLAKNNLSHFSLVNDYLNRLQKFYSENSNEKIIDFTNSYQKEIDGINIRIFKNAARFIQGKNVFLSLSNSKTLVEFFKLLKQENKKLKVIVSESRPKFEGRIFAKELLKNNIKVELITDAMISLYITKIDAVILGADIILKNGNVVNKVGSKSAAVIARYYKKPVYIIASGNKFSKKINYKSPIENPDEIWNYKNYNLKISNYYFEEIEKKLITKVITD